MKRFMQLPLCIAAILMLVVTASCGSDNTIDDSDNIGSDGPTIELTIDGNKTILKTVSCVGMDMIGETSWVASFSKFGSSKVEALTLAFADLSDNFPGKVWNNNSDPTDFSMVIAFSGSSIENYSMFRTSKIDEGTISLVEYNRNTNKMVLKFNNVTFIDSSDQSWRVTVKGNIECPINYSPID